MISTFVELLINFDFESCRLFNQFRKGCIAFVIRLIDKRLKPIVEFAINRAAAMNRLFKGVETTVIPHSIKLFSCSFDKRNVNVNVAGLTNPIKATNSLLQKTGIVGKIKKHEVMGELKITALTSNFRTEQNAGTADIIRKPGCVFVALQKAEAFVKHRSSRADFLAKRCFNLLDKFLCLCD